jgi:hypothetical protein
MGAVFACLLIGQTATASVAQWQAIWPTTDFTQTTIDLDEVLSGGPPKDGIPALDNPVMLSIADAPDLPPREPVLTLALPGHAARAYPIRYLLWHEIVNDTVGDIPVAVTFCPLCNSGMVFDRRVAGEVLSFGVSGLLRHSDMIMFDRQTDSWWQQAIGQGIVGTYSGQTLSPLPAWMESWETFRASNPEGLVMDTPDWPRAYGRNPYVSYDSSLEPFLFRGALPENGVPALARVIRVGNRAWPMERIRREGIIAEAGLTLTWEGEQASALDAATVAQGRDVGSIRVRDASGHDVAHDVPFAFAFHAFFPAGEWMLGQ